MKCLNFQETIHVNIIEFGLEEEGSSEGGDGGFSSVSDDLVKSE